MSSIPFFRLARRGKGAAWEEAQWECVAQGLGGFGRARTLTVWSEERTRQRKVLESLA